jgi:hypothetical protein
MINRKNILKLINLKNRNITTQTNKEKIENYGSRIKNKRTPFPEIFH